MAGKKLTAAFLETLAEDKSKLLQEFIDAQPPQYNGESLLALWDQIYDEEIQKTVVKTLEGPSDDETNYVFPYDKLQAVVGDGGNWKWPKMWQTFDEIERRGSRYREGEDLNYKMPNKNACIAPQTVLVVGGGPVGIRMAIELKMGGHEVVQVERRREIKNADGTPASLGFTNRINRPHMWPFVRNDLGKLNGRDFLSKEARYPVFTEPETSSIGIDELQVLLLKNAMLLGVDFRLGVAYENAKANVNEETCMPSWDVELKYDDTAAEKFGVKPGKNITNFTCLVGCDGPRTKVRDTQQKYFGTIEKRKFMDACGIVANVQKLSRKRLKEMGFEFGQEPGDMNKTKMVFKDFFGKIQSEADADIESLIYYKASTHNYCILVPKRDDLIKHGLSGQLYSFEATRAAGSNPKIMEEKIKTKKYCAAVLKAAGIPVDPNASNDGFVGEPNDCMAFDFAECWNTKKSLAFNYPPYGYSVEEDGEWEGRRLIPFVALAGDSLLEPFWPMGLGLKRGWQAIMDTNYCIDNLLNREMFAVEKGKDPETFDWEEHYDALVEKSAQNFESCNRLQVAAELSLGEYEDKGQVMTQLRRFMKDATKPPLEVEIDPATRYAKGAKEIETKWKNMTQQERNDNLHPRVQKRLNQLEYYKDRESKGKDGNFLYDGKELISINGKVKGGYGQQGKRPSLSDKPKGPKKPVKGPAFGNQAKKDTPGSMAAAMCGAKVAPKSEEPEAESSKEVKENVDTRATIAKMLKDMEALTKTSIPTSQESGLTELRKMRELMREQMDKIIEAEAKLAKEMGQ